MRRVLPANLLLAVSIALLGIAMLVPMAEGTAEVVERTGPSSEGRAVKVSHATYTVWGVSDPFGGREGTYLDMESIQVPASFTGDRTRGDLAPWLAPAVLLAFGLATASLIVAPRAAPHITFRLALGACLVAIVLITFLLHDLQGLGPRIAAEAQAQYDAERAGSFRALPYQSNSLGFGITVMFFADVALLLATVATRWIRAPSSSPLPSIDD